MNLEIILSQNFRLKSTDSFSFKLFWIENEASCAINPGIFFAIISRELIEFLWDQLFKPIMHMYFIVFAGNDFVSSCEIWSGIRDCCEKSGEWNSLRGRDSNASQKSWPGFCQHHRSYERRKSTTEHDSYCVQWQKVNSTHRICQRNVFSRIWQQQVCQSQMSHRRGE